MNSFPRSAWECSVRRSASSGLVPQRDAERPGRHSHAERGNEEFALSHFSSSTRAHARSLPNVLQSCSVQTTFLSGVTSMSCGFLGPAWQFPKTMLPFGRTSTVVTQASVMPGSSSCSTDQTVLPSGVTSMTRLPLPQPIRVLPLGLRRALKTEVPWPSWPPLAGRPAGARV